MIDFSFLSLSLSLKKRSQQQKVFYLQNQFSFSHKKNRQQKSEGTPQKGHHIFLTIRLLCFFCFPLYFLLQVSFFVFGFPSFFFSLSLILSRFPSRPFSDFSQDVEIECFDLLSKPFNLLESHKQPECPGQLQGLCPLRVLLCVWRCFDDLVN